MAVITSASYSPIEIFNQRWPQECPKAMAFDLQFDTGAPGGADSFDLNLLQPIEQGSIEGVQACYYDNISNNSPVEVLEASTGFRTRFQAQWFGQRTLLFPTKPNMIFRCTGGTGIFRIILTNTPLSPYDQDGS
jgi:hypothetical protein